MPTRSTNNLQCGGLQTQIMTTSIIVIMITVAGFTLVSHFAAQDYTTRLSAIAHPLRQQIQTYEKTTYVSLFDDPSAPDAQQQKEGATILQQSDAIMTGVASLTRTTATLRPIPWANLNGEYQKASLLQGKSRDSVEQITDAITHYRQLVEFLQHYSRAQAELHTQLDAFNAIRDFNIYVGQGDKFRTIATSLRQTIQSLQSAPHDVDTLRINLVTVAAQTADEFDTLATALDSRSDLLIYSATTRIETIGKSLDNYDQTTYAKTLADSRTLRTIRGLGDALDLLQ